MEWIISLVIGLLAGGVAGYYYSFGKSKQREEELNRNLSETEKELAVHREQARALTERQKELEDELDKSQEELLELNRRISAMQAENKNLNEKLTEGRKEIEELHKKLTMEFENIAGRVLRQQSSDFSELSRKNIGDVLNPLKEKLTQFEEKVQKTYEKGLSDQTDLKAELKRLHELNSQLSEEARNLTSALRSDSKKLGNWGEFVLERILERSGLTRGQEYEVQETFKDESGKMLRPDVIVHLPDKKHIIIDSKVSEVAWEAFVSADDEAERQKYLKQHIDSVRNHVKDLSSKNYPYLPGVDSPDFVLMFMPIEAAFSAAVQADTDLFGFAWERNIVIVSPSTLLATLRTVASIWKHEKQTQNALEIARQGGALYDKFVNFLKNLEDIGTHIRRLDTSYTDAMKKLSTGRGNLIRQVESLKELGARTSKQIGSNLLEGIEE